MTCLLSECHRSKYSELKCISDWRCRNSQVYSDTTAYDTRKPYSHIVVEAGDQCLQTLWVNSLALYFYFLVILCDIFDCIWWWVEDADRCYLRMSVRPSQKRAIAEVIQVSMNLYPISILRTSFQAPSAFLAPYNVQTLCAFRYKFIAQSWCGVLITSQNYAARLQGPSDNPRVNWMMVWMKKHIKKKCT